MCVTTIVNYKPKKLGRFRRERAVLAAQASEGLKEAGLCRSSTH